MQEVAVMMVNIFMLFAVEKILIINVNRSYTNNLMLQHFCDNAAKRLQTMFGNCYISVERLV